MVEFAPLGANKILCGGRLAVIQNNVLLDKTMNFSVRIVRSCQYLVKEKK